MSRTRDWNSADYAATIIYGVSGQTTITGAAPIYGQTGGGTTTQSGTIRTYGSGYPTTSTYSGMSTTPPAYGITGYMPYSRTETDRFFAIRMVDIKQSTTENFVPVYEGSVSSSGTAKTFEQVGACLIEALFRDFRGTGSGRAAITVDECG